MRASLCFPPLLALKFFLEVERVDNLFRLKKKKNCQIIQYAVGMKPFLNSSSAESAVSIQYLRVKFIYTVGSRYEK